MLGCWTYVKNLFIIAKFYIQFIVRDNAAADDNYALQWAAFHGQTEVVLELLKIPLVRDNAAADKNVALRMAACYGHLSVVSELLKIQAVCSDTKSLILLVSLQLVLLDKNTKLQLLRLIQEAIKPQVLRAQTEINNCFRVCSIFIDENFIETWTRNEEIINLSNYLDGYIVKLSEPPVPICSSSPSSYVPGFTASSSSSSSPSSSIACIDDASTNPNKRSEPERRSNEQKDDTHKRARRN